MPRLFDVPPPVLTARAEAAPRRAVEAALFAVVVGLPDGALGVLWPSLRADLDRPVGDLGTLVAAATVPYLLASACAGAVSRRFGYAGPVRVATAAATVVLAGWALAPGWGAVLVGMAALGGARGAVDGAVNVDAGVAGDTDDVCADKPARPGPPEYHAM